MTTNKPEVVTVCEDKLRAEFEAWAVSEGYARDRMISGHYIYAVTSAAWQAWKASRAALVIELPRLPSLDDFNDIGQCAASRNMHYACRRAIEAAGVQVKP